MVKALIVAFIVLSALGIVIWASDQVTLQGERTIYTVNCNGEWEHLRCNGRMSAGDRHRFLASRIKNEVVYWVAGSTMPFGKYGNCQVKDRDNWTCIVSPGDPMGIITELSWGRPTANGTNAGTAFHAVQKWKWWLLDIGVSGFTSADFGSGSNAPKQKRGHLNKTP